MRWPRPVSTQATWTDETTPAASEQGIAAARMSGSVRSPTFFGPHSAVDFVPFCTGQTVVIR